MREILVVPVPVAPIYRVAIVMTILIIFGSARRTELIAVMRRAGSLSRRNASYVHATVTGAQESMILSASAKIVKQSGRRRLRNGMLIARLHGSWTGSLGATSSTKDSRFAFGTALKT
jgi:hypothetical protein